VWFWRGGFEVKRFDRYSIRGVIFSTLGVAGIVYEVLFAPPVEVFVVVLYSMIVLLGLWLVFVYVSGS
jgi:hypothetical protein